MVLSRQTASMMLYHHLCWLLWTWSWMEQISSTRPLPHKLPLQSPSFWCSTAWNIHKKMESSVRHNRSRETPLPLYLALKISAVTRSRGLVDTLYSLGMCVSYDRMLHISSDIANGVCQRFRSEDVVCPPKLRQGLFTMAAVDNIDHSEWVSE